MRKRLSRLASGIALIWLFALTAVVVRREFRNRIGAWPEINPAIWDRLLAAGQRMGTDSAPITVVEFPDFQCPFCGQLVPILDSVATSYPKQVSLLYLHLPLASHPHAMDAAIASECAAVDGKFREFHNVLFANQDAIGETTWARLAEAAGVKDIGAFENCRGSEQPRTAVERDVGLARELGIAATPTLIVDGHMRSGVPPLTDLVDEINRAFCRREHAALLCLARDILR